MDYLEVIYLHGDGAGWINEGLNWLPKSKKVLDRYHLNKAFKKVSGEQFGNLTILKKGKVTPMFNYLSGIKNGDNIL